MSGGLRGLFNTIVGNFRNNKSASFAYGLSILGSGITAILAILAVLAATGEIRPAQFLQALGYALMMFIFDFNIIRNIAFWLRFAGPELFGLISFSSIISVVTLIGAIFIGLSWYQSQ